MGRLILNVLLSFVQFEREVIGERMRDKIAASKAKGLWVGGSIPLGYASINKKLVIVPMEAETVRLIFRRYLELGSIRDLAEDLDHREIRTRRQNLSMGQIRGGNGDAETKRQALERGAEAMLTKPIDFGTLRSEIDTRAERAA